MRRQTARRRPGTRCRARRPKRGPEAAACGAGTGQPGTIRAITAVCRGDDGHPLLPPCGNCRQLIFDYSPDAAVILDLEGELVKVSVRELLPAPYQSWSRDEGNGVG